MHVIVLIFYTIYAHPMGRHIYYKNKNLKMHIMVLIFYNIYTYQNKNLKMHVMVLIFL